jgi:hypothetical protein
MVISAVVTFHVRDGKQDDHVQNLRAVKRLVERAGGTVCCLLGEDSQLTSHSCRRGAPPAH